VVLTVAKRQDRPLLSLGSCKCVVFRSFPRRNNCLKATSNQQPLPLPLISPRRLPRAAGPGLPANGSAPICPSRASALPPPSWSLAWPGRRTNTERTLRPVAISRSLALSLEAVWAVCGTPSCRIQPFATRKSAALWQVLSFKRNKKAYRVPNPGRARYRGRFGAAASDPTPITVILRLRWWLRPSIKILGHRDKHCGPRNKARRPVPPPLF
jgi:hypothetical protein